MTKEDKIRVVIIEDERPARELIREMLLELEPEWQISAGLESIESAVDWFRSHEQPNLAFVDIQLSDGLSFEIFDQINYDGMVIFTTAYDEYALRAFRVNSIDYLLKPIRRKALKQAIGKYKKWVDSQNGSKPEKADLTNLIQKFINQEPAYRTRFLIRKGDSYEILTTKDIAYFNTMGHSATAVTNKNTRQIIDFTLDELEDQLNPHEFFRISRQMIVNIEAIRKIHRLFNGRLGLELQPKFDGKATVSRQRVNDFKKWVDG